MPVSGCASLQFPISLTLLMELAQAVLAENLPLWRRPLAGQCGLGDRIHPVIGKVGDLRCLWNGLAIA